MKKEEDQARSRARLKARRAILANAAEQMIALIRLHVAGCPRCELKLCDDGMKEILSRIDERLASSLRRSGARAAKPSRARRVGRRR